MEATERPKRIFCNENLTAYRREMTGLAVKKKGDEKLIKCGHSKRKIFIKTSPTGIPHQMYSVEDIRIFKTLFSILSHLNLLGRMGQNFLGYSTTYRLDKCMYSCVLLLSAIIIHQMFSLARDWSKQVT